MENYNNKIRDIVFDKKSTTDGLPLFLDGVGKMFYDHVKNSDNEVIKKMFVSVLFLDLYKYFNLFSKDGISFEPNNRKMFEHLDSFKTYDEIEEFILGSEEVFELSIEHVYQLKKSSVLYKIMTYEVLTYEQNKKLIELFPNHEADLNRYNINVDMNYIIEKINQSYKSHNDIYNMVKDLVCYLNHAQKNNKPLFDDYVKEIVDVLKNNNEVYETPASETEAYVLKIFNEMKNMDEETLKKYLSENFDKLSMTASLFITYKTDYSKLISDIEKGL